MLRIIFANERRDSSLLSANIPSVALQGLASRTEALAVVLAKVVTPVGDCNLLADVDISYGVYLYAIFCGIKLRVCFTVMVREAPWSKEYRFSFVATGRDDSEVAVRRLQHLLLFDRQAGQNSRKVLNCPFVIGFRAVMQASGIVE